MGLIHGRMVELMPDNKNVGENLMTIADAAQMTGVRLDILEYHIESGVIGSHCGLVSTADCARIMEQKESLTGLRKFLKQYDNGRFESRYVKHRDKIFWSIMVISGSGFMSQRQSCLKSLRMRNFTSVMKMPCSSVLKARGFSGNTG